MDLCNRQSSSRRRLVCLHTACIVGVLLVGLLVSEETLSSRACAQPTDELRVQRDIVFAAPDGHALALDLYLPPAASNSAAGTRPSLLVWVHGGAWKAGSRQDMPLKQVVRAGFAVASVDYRLSPVAPFPAQIHDLKAAIRFLRARAADYGYSAERVGISGSSAGGHLAALVGVTNDVAELEGTVGEHTEQSSDVQAIVDLYGPTNLTTILAQSTPHGLSVRVPALQLLLGGQPDEQVALARLASPVSHVDADDPPLLIIHGDQDPQVPINQSHELQGAYAARQLPCELFVVHGGAHGGPGFVSDERQAHIANFLKLHLQAAAPTNH